mgnify:FL=1
MLDFDAFWIPVTEGALSSLARRCCVPSSAAKNAAEKMGMHGATADRGGILCAGTYAQMSDAVRESFLEYGAALPADLEGEVYRAFQENIPRGKVLPTSPGLRGVLESLRREGYKLFVVTTDNAEITGMCLEQLGITGLFERVYTDGAGYPAKPDPYIIDMLAKEFSFARNDLFMVGDTLTDMMFAHRGRIAGIGLAQRSPTDEAFARSADVLISDLAELPAVLKGMV